MNEIFDQITEMVEEGLYSVINNPEIVVLNILALLVLLFFVRTFLWKKVTAYLDKRQVALLEAIDQADHERSVAKSLQEKSLKEYEGMKEETRQLKEKLVLEAYQEQEKLVTNAKNEAKRRLEQAEKDIEYEIAQANEEIKQSIKEIAFSAASKIVKREIDESVHQDIIDEILEERDI
ncbi:MAG: F0F1 ATP synthase subunit B [Acholeplasmataceae bacterium]|nr:F0F1 ATP synthase subunit B [Acholeplasmataceae bacterium]